MSVAYQVEIQLDIQFLDSSKKYDLYKFVRYLGIYSIESLLQINNTIEIGLQTVEAFGIHRKQFFSY